MRKILSLAISILCLVSLNAQTFEGTIEMTYFEGKDELQTFKWFLSDEKIAMETEMEKDGKSYLSKFFPNLTTATLTVTSVTPSGNFIYETPASKIEGENVVVTEIQQTGEFQKIAGYNCEKYVMLSENYKIESWIASDIDVQLWRFADFFKSFYELQAFKKEKKTGFILASTVWDFSGNSVFALKVGKVNPEPVDQSVFEIPEGFSEIKK
jgi:hypothetical protein